MDYGAAVGERAGIPREKLDAIDDYRDPGVLAPLEKRVIELAERLTSTPANVPDELYDALAAELSPAQLVELAEVIASENHRARFNRTFNIGSQDYAVRR